MPEGEAEFNQYIDRNQDLLDILEILRDLNNDLIRIEAHHSNRPVSKKIVSMYAAVAKRLGR